MNLFKFNRRSVLAGAGTLLPLPSLEAFGGDNVDPEKPPRLISAFMPNGVHPKHWVPEKTGADFELSPILEPLKAYQKDILVVSGLSNGGKGGNHFVSTAGFLAGDHRRSSNSEGGASIDQIVAQRDGSRSLIPHLHVGTEPPRSGGYQRACSVSWADKKTLLFPELNPRTVFDRIFRDTSSPEAKTAARRRKSILDVVLSDAKALSGKVSRYDKDKLDQYMTAVRGVEQQLDRIISPPKPTREENLPRAEDKMRPDDGLPTDVEKHVEIMADLIVLGLWSKTTNVATFMMGHGLSRKSFTFLDGVHNDHHVCSHHRDDEAMIEEYKLVSRWHVEQIARIMQKLSAIDDFGQSMMDSSLLLFGSGMSQGNTHSASNIPLLLAGTAGGRIRTGRHLAFKDNRLHSDLLLSILQTMEVPVKEFAGSHHAIDLT